MPFRVLFEMFEILTKRLYHQRNQRVHVTNTVISSAHDWSSVYLFDILYNEVFSSYHVTADRQWPECSGPSYYGRWISKDIA